MNWKDQERIQILIPKEDLIEVFGEGVQQGVDVTLESELYISTTEKISPTIRIFYEPQHRYDDYLATLHQSKFNILTYLSTDIDAQDNVYDFTESVILKFNKGNGYWEQGKAYFEIVLDKLITRTSNRSSDIHATLNFDSNSFMIVDDVFNYDIFDFENDKKFEATSKIFPSHVQFGEFEVEIQVQFERKFQSANSFLVERYARLELSKLYNEDYDDLNEVRLESRLIISLLSLYYNYTIEQIYSRYHMKSCTTIEVVNDGEELSATLNDNLHKSGFNHVLEFIESIDREAIRDHEIFIINIIKQYLFSTKLNDEARFMILYNVVEQFRNYYIKTYLPSSFEGRSEDYKTIGPRKAVTRFIKDRIKCVVSVIDPEDREEFLKNASNKVSFLKKKQMNNQLSSFFDTIEVNYDNEILTGLLRLRNKVYHGSIAIDGREQIASSVEELEKIIYQIFRHFLKILEK